MNLIMTLSIVAGTLSILTGIFFILKSSFKIPQPVRVSTRTSKPDYANNRQSQLNEKESNHVHQKESKTKS